MTNQKTLYAIGLDLWNKVSLQLCSNSEIHFKQLIKLEILRSSTLEQESSDWLQKWNIPIKNVGYTRLWHMINTIFGGKVYLARKEDR